jgi:hypothetical protein
MKEPTVNNQQFFHAVGCLKISFPLPPPKGETPMLIYQSWFFWSLIKSSYEPLARNSPAIEKKRTEIPDNRSSVSSCLR